jgi:hypothetical protein
VREAGKLDRAGEPILAAPLHRGVQLAPATAFPVPLGIALLTLDLGVPKAVDACRDDGGAGAFAGQLDGGRTLRMIPVMPLVLSRRRGLDFICKGIRLRLQTDFKCIQACVFPRFARPRAPALGAVAAGSLGPPRFLLGGQAHGSRLRESETRILSPVANIIPDSQDIYSIKLRFSDFACGEFGSGRLQGARRSLALHRDRYHS